MLLLSSGLFYLIGGSVLFLICLALRQPKSVKASSALLLLLGGFNLFVDQERAVGPQALMGAAILLIILFAIAYAYLCASVLERIGFLSRWQVIVGAYLHAFYPSLLGVFLLWFIKSDVEQRGLALYVFVVFVLSIHVALFISTITRPERILKREPVPTTQSLVPPWFWIALGSVTLLAIVGEQLGRRDWTLLSLNLLTTLIFIAPFVVLSFKWRSG